MAFTAISLQIFWQKFYGNVPWEVLYQPYEFCPNRWIWLVAMVTETLNLRKKYSKIFYSEAIMGMKLKLCRNVHNISLYNKLKLCRNVHNISLYNNYVFYCRCYCAFFAMATFSFHRLIMGQMKVGLYFYLIADILTKVFQKCSLGGLLPNIWFFSKPLNLIVCHGNRNAKVAQKY